MFKNLCNIPGGLSGYNITIADDPSGLFTGITDFFTPPQQNCYFISNLTGYVYSEAKDDKGVKYNITGTVYPSRKINNR